MTGNWSAATPTSGDITSTKDCRARLVSSGSSADHSDDEDQEIEAGPCEQSTDHPIDLKRIRRYLVFSVLINSSHPLSPLSFNRLYMYIDYSAML